MREQRIDHLASPDPMLERRARLRIGVGAAVVLVLGALAAAVVVALLTPGGATAVVSTAPRSSASASARATSSGGATAPSASPIYVHLLGAVAHPGLYRLSDGSRAVDAVAAAGGFTADADRGSVNLARELVDGEQIVVTVQGAAPLASSGGPGSSSSGAPASGARVNLNTADATALETLPRIGPAMAQRIIDWRTKNGRFAAVEDLLDVTGVGDATFAGLKDLVTV